MEELKVPDHILKICEENGYEVPVMTKHYGVIAIQKYLFTWGVVVDINESSYHRRYCYPTSFHAIQGHSILQALDQLEDETKIPLDPPDPYWIKRKGFVEEISNPNAK